MNEMMKRAEAQAERFQTQLDNQRRALDALMDMRQAILDACSEALDDDNADAPTLAQHVLDIIQATTERGDATRERA